MATRIRIPEPVRLSLRRGAPRVLGWLVATVAIALVIGLAWYAFGAGTLETPAEAGDRQSFIAALQEQLRELGNALERIGQRIAGAGSQTRKDLKDQQGQLKDLQARFQRLLEDAQTHTDETWQKADPHLKKSWHELQEGLRKLVDGAK